VTALASSGSQPGVEPVEDFRARARVWIADHLPRSDPNRRADKPYQMPAGADEAVELAEVARNRGLQRLLWDGGFAGICFPREYGGLGLTPEHQRAFNEETRGFELPALIQVPTFVPCGAVLLDFGTEEQKRRHIPAMLRGEEIWMQFLSEPSGGSDVAGALTTAVRDGDDWILNGSKVWTTGAWYSDYGLCLVRTNWDVPKHRGLSVFIVGVHDPGVELHRIEMIDGTREFCQEFLTDVRVPDANRVGDVDDGWTVGTGWMFHERHAMGGGSPYVTGVRHGNIEVPDAPDRLVELARQAGRLDDPRVRELIGEHRVLARTQAALTRRIAQGVELGVMPDTSAAIARLMSAEVVHRSISIALEIAGPAAAGAEPGDLFAAGTEFLVRQTASIGGGTTEMARNNVAERVLGMPREYNPYSNVPFRDVPKGRSGA
jgi:alkylation response protein AidB-like acyl-CoA dehydrogenase